MNKSEFQKMLLDMVEPLKGHFSPGKAEINLGATAAGYGNRIAKMEGFSRLLWGLVPYWAGGGKDESLLPNIICGIKNGTNPDHDEYWGILGEKDQRMVEMAAISYAILMIPEKIWDPLTDKEKCNFAKWLWQINEHSLAENNWQYFNVITNIALRSVGMPYSKERMEIAMEKYESFYLGNGWYSDGLRPQKDYYISFAIHYYCLLYAKFMEKEDSSRSKLFIDRAKQFAKTFIYWFDDEGKALPFGRSLTYRFAQVAFFSACALVGVDCFPLGVIKGLIERHLNYWMEQPIFDNGNILSLGYNYPNLIMSEAYNATGSPYWSFKAFSFLALPDNHPFWSVESELYPKVCKTKEIKECDMIIQHREGEVVALTAGQYPTMNHTHAAEKYAKFAYSSRFGFSVPRSYCTVEEAGLDSMLSFFVNGMYYVRRRCEEVRIENNEIFSRWSPVDGIEVETRLIPTDHGHIREHKIISKIACEAVEGGFSFPDNLSLTKSEKGKGYATVFDPNGKSMIISQSGQGIIINSVPNTNLVFPNTLIPAVKYEIIPGENMIISKVETSFKSGKIMIGKGNCYEFKI